jgi:hypothetical protein
MNAQSPLWAVILVGALSGVIGSFLGPLLTRFIARSDKALDARQEWAKIKLLTVFGLGEEPFASDGIIPPFWFLTPPNGWRFHFYDMHQINHGVEESIDLMMLQPKRSKWARDWLYNWHFALQPQASYLHHRMHIAQSYIGSDLQRYADDQMKWEKDNAAYEKKVRKVESAFSRWASGQASRPSILMWLANRKWVVERRSFWKHHPKDFDGVMADERGRCDCWEKNQQLEKEAAEAQAAWEAEQAASREGTDAGPTPPITSQT